MKLGDALSRSGLTLTPAQFYLMLIIMTYNAQCIGAVLLYVGLRFAYTVRPADIPLFFTSLSLQRLVSSLRTQLHLHVHSGAFIGHFVFQRSFDLSAGAGDDDSKGLSCH